MDTVVFDVLRVERLQPMEIRIKHKRIIKTYYPVIINAGALVIPCL